MKFVRRNGLVIILSAGLLLCQRGPAGAQTQQTDDYSHMDIAESGGAAGEPAEVQMARAIAAGPRHVTNSARIVGADAQGKRMVLREGGNGFTCQPGNPKVPRPSRIVFERGGAPVECGYGCAQSQADER
jgi:hypothetical protein